MKLTNGTPKQIGQGKWNYKVVATTGTAVLQYEVSNEGANDVADTLTTNENKGININLPSCYVTAVITGDAEVYLNLIK